MPDDRIRTVEIDVPSDLCLANETWRLRYWGRIDQPDGERVLVATCVPVIDGVASDAPRDLTTECSVLGTALAGAIARHACCDEHAAELARSIAEEIVAYVRTRRALDGMPTDVPN